MTQKLKAFTEERGVSPVIGTVLMIAVVVVLAAVIGAFVFGIGDGLNEPAPSTTFDTDTDTGVVWLSHGGGDSITNDNTHQLRVIIEDKGELPWAFSGAPNDPFVHDLDEGPMTSGATTGFGVTHDEQTPSPGDRVVVVWESPDQSNSAILYDFTIPTAAAAGGGVGGGGAACTVDGSEVDPDYDGDGTTSDPYQISDVEELQCMDHDRDAHYELVNDIDASGTASWNDGDGFDPISPFAGSLDGNGYTITGLTIDRTDHPHVGMFEWVDGTVENVNFVDADITGDNRAGIVTSGVDSSAALSNIDVNGFVATTSSGGQAGGVTASNYGIVDDVTSTVTVDAATSAGGVVGAGAGTVSNAHADGVDVTSTESGVGGVVGQLEPGGVVTESTATGTAIVDENAGGGGVVGLNILGTVEYSTSAVTVHGDDLIGGVVGHNEEGTVMMSYSTGDTTGDLGVGGVVGLNTDGDVNGAYFDTDVSSESDAIGDSNGGTVTDVDGLTTSEMQGSSAESNMDAFDFESVWETITDEYPVLQ